MKQRIQTQLAPAAIGPYSQGITHKNTLYVSGQLGISLHDGSLSETIEAQTRNALYNLKSIVEAAGSRMDRILKVTIFLTDEEEFHTMNQVYEQFFPETPPARECVIVQALPKKGARVEISCVAYVREDV